VAGNVRSIRKKLLIIGKVSESYLSKASNDVFGISFSIVQYVCHNLSSPSKYFLRGLPITSN